MNLLAIAYKSVRQRALASSLTALSVALGVMLMVAVLVIYSIVDRVFSQTATGYDLIIGPKGGSLQLVLNAIYRIQPPVENLPYRYYREFKDDVRVAEAIPVALGDTTRHDEGSFPIVGTVPRYFVVEYMPNKKFRRKGEIIRNPFDTIIGWEVARKNNWDIGTKVSLVHGGMEAHVHDEEFTIVGVLEKTGTPNDKTVFVHLDGFYQLAGHDKPFDEAIERHIKFWPEDADYYRKLLKEHNEKQKKDEPNGDKNEHEAHNGEESHHGQHHHDIPEEQKEVTAILVQMKDPFFTLLLQSELQEGTQAQAVNPIEQIRNLMDYFVSPVRTVLVVLTALIIAVSGMSIFVSIFNSMADRRREIAIMRALGARRQTVFSIILAESVLLCFGGGLIGFALGHTLVFAAAPYVASITGLLIDPLSFEPWELVLLPSLIVLASLIGIIPGVTAYRTDVAKTLSN